MKFTQVILHKPFPKMARMFRNCVITEKIDGTNACIHINEDGQFLIGSRTRWITPDADNFGFARWATDHQDQLQTLGPGTHFGEWWGSGIQRGYGLKERRFSLFNTLRWCPHGQAPKQVISQDPTAPVKMQDMLPPCCDIAPVLFEGLFDSDRVSLCIDKLVEWGSYAAPGFRKPEGVICYHVAAGIGFKTTIEKDYEPKGLCK